MSKIYFKKAASFKTFLRRNFSEKLPVSIRINVRKWYFLSVANSAGMALAQLAEK